MSELPGRPRSDADPAASASSTEGRVRLRALRHLILDLDGTVYLGGRIFPWTRPFLETIRELGIGRTFVTNNNSRSLSESVAKLNGLGIPAGPEELYTSTRAMIELLREEAPAWRRLFVLGTPSLVEEIHSAGFAVAGDDPADEPDAVVVGFDTTLRYDRLARAAYWIGRGKPFVATHPDRVCPTEEEIVLPDCGSICACLAHATGRRPDFVPGKPDPRMVRGALRGKGVEIHEVAVVGDRLYTNLRMARESGALGILVLSGETRREDLSADPGAADIVVEDLGELARLLRELRGGRTAV